MYANASLTDKHCAATFLNCLIVASDRFCFTTFSPQWWSITFEWGCHFLTACFYPLVYANVFSLASVLMPSAHCPLLALSMLEKEGMAALRSLILKKLQYTVF